MGWLGWLAGCAAPVTAPTTLFATVGVSGDCTGYAEGSPGTAGEISNRTDAQVRFRLVDREEQEYDRPIGGSLVVLEDGGWGMGGGGFVLEPGEAVQVAAVGWIEGCDVFGGWPTEGAARKVDVVGRFEGRRWEQPVTVEVRIEETAL